MAEINKCESDVMANIVQQTDGVVFQKQMLQYTTEIQGRILLPHTKNNRCALNVYHKHTSAYTSLFRCSRDAEADWVS